MTRDALCEMLKPLKIQKIKNHKQAFKQGHKHVSLWPSHFFKWEELSGNYSMMCNILNTTIWSCYTVSGRNICPILQHLLYKNANNKYSYGGILQQQNAIIEKDIPTQGIKQKDFTTYLNMQFKGDRSNIWMEVEKCCGATAQPLCDIASIGERGWQCHDADITLQLWGNVAHTWADHFQHRLSKYNKGINKYNNKQTQ